MVGTKIGARFEEEVADLYRLLGATVVQGVEVCQKKVDLLATFPLPGSSGGHRVIIECKDERRLVADNQRVMQFKGLLETARKSGDADSAEIITRVPWSEAAKGFARESGVHIHTYADKVAQLIDFRMYLKDVIANFDNRNTQRPSDPPLARFYVESTLQPPTETRSSLVFADYLPQWLARDSDRHHIAILSGYGTGKTSLCHKLAYDLAKQYLEEPRPEGARIPIHVDLRDFTKTIRIEPFISSFLDERCGVLSPRFKLFSKMNDAGLFLLIFDGFDEMATRVDADTLEINIVEIEKLVGSPKSKLIITSRAEYFSSAAEQDRLFRPRSVTPRPLDSRMTQYEGFQIRPWNEKQVNEFLRLRVPLVSDATHPWQYYRDQIKKIRGLRDLAKRPVLLDMIVKTLPLLIQKRERINRPNIYHAYLTNELHRQKIEKRRVLLLSEDGRWRILKDLAVDVITKKIGSITFGDAAERVRKLGPPDSEREAYTRDFLTCSFLIREGDTYTFSHRSIMEYLAAAGLVERLEANENAAWARLPFSVAVVEFIVEMRPPDAALEYRVKLSRNKPNLAFLSGNAVSVLARLRPDGLRNVDLSGSYLRGADLRLTDLTKVKLAGVRLHECNLAGARFRRRDFERGVSFDECTFSVAMICKPRDRDPEPRVKALFERAKFHGVMLESSKWQAVGEHVVAVAKARVADIDNLHWIEQAIGRESWVRVRAIYSEEYDSVTSSFAEDIVGAMNVLLGPST